MEKSDSTFTIKDNILKGKETSYEDEYPSLGQFVLDALGSNLDLVGQVAAATGESQTQREMIDRSVRCAIWMRSQGILKADNVTICSHNQLDVQNACFGTLYLGATVTPWDEGLNAKDFRRLLILMKPKVAFVSKKKVNAVAEAAREVLPDLKIVVFGRALGFLEFEGVIGEPEAEDIKNFICPQIEALHTIAMIMCSSGTTGPPKGVAISHGALLREVHYLKRFGITGNHYVVFSAISWISGTLWLFTNLFSNVTRIVPPPFEEYSACEMIEKYKPNFIFLGTSMVSRLLKSGALEKYDLSSVRGVIYGGAPLPIRSWEAFSKCVPNAVFNQTYGLTETCGCFAVQRVNSKPGSCGEIIENARLKVVDPDTGIKLGPNQRGELLLKTGSIMSFYYNDPRATAEAVDEEGWFHSGDLGYYDEDGEIFVVERLKELIKYRGHHYVSPSEIQTVIMSHPGVKEVVIVGVPHPVDDEHPLAFVVKAIDSTGAEEQVAEKEIVDLVAAEMSDSQRLRGGVRFIDGIPKTPTGKARRKELLDLAKSIAEIEGDRRRGDF